MKILQFFLISLLVIALSGCGISTFQCDDCEDPFTPNNCTDQHSQFHQGVIYTLASGDTEFFELDAIDPFNEQFLIGTTLTRIGENLILVSSKDGNYLIDVNSMGVRKLNGEDVPVYGYLDAQNLYFKTQTIGDITINDSTFLEDFVSETSLLKSSVESNLIDTVAHYKSRFIHPDTLLIPRIFFPLEIAELEGFIALAEDEMHYISVSSTTNRIRTAFEYKQRSWKHFNSSGEVISTLTFPRKVITEVDPTSPFLSIDPFIISHQEEDRVVVSNIKNGSVSFIDDAQSPKISENGEFISVTSQMLIDVISLETGEKINVSEVNDYSEINPSEFSSLSNALLFTERAELSPALTDAVIKRATFLINNPVSTGIVFELSDHIVVDSLDYLISRASQPVFINDRKIFFLLFQHQLDSCERFF